MVQMFFLRNLLLKEWCNLIKKSIKKEINHLNSFYLVCNVFYFQFSAIFNISKCISDPISSVSSAIFIWVYTGLPKHTHLIEWNSISPFSENLFLSLTSNWFSMYLWRYDWFNEFKLFYLIWNNAFYSFILIYFWHSWIHLLPKKPHLALTDRFLNAWECLTMFNLKMMSIYFSLEYLSPYWQSEES